MSTEQKTSIETDILIIGAGQQGLALGKTLQSQSRKYTILEGCSTIGLQWENQYDSLELFTPRKFCSLPGLSLSGDPSGYVGKDEFVHYLRQYAESFKLPIVFNARVVSLSKTNDGFVTVTESKTYHSRSVIIATGYRTPLIPSFSSKLSENVFQIHSSVYKNAAQIPKGTVLVVGNGNSAIQIAIELSRTHNVSMAIEKMPTLISRKILNISYYWWHELLGLHHIPARSSIGQFVSKFTDYVVGTEIRIAIHRGGVTLLPAATDALKEHIVFANGTRNTYDAIIWATGYIKDTSWIHIPELFDAQGAIREPDGICNIPGIYFAGLHGQFTFVSSNISGAKLTARKLSKILARGR